MVIFIIVSSETGKVSFPLVFSSDKIWYSEGLSLEVFEGLKMNASLCRF